MSQTVVLHLEVRVDSASDADAALRVVTDAAQKAADDPEWVRKSWRDPYPLREVDQ